jgi:hypothetical protein
MFLGATRSSAARVVVRQAAAARPSPLAMRAGSPLLVARLPSGMTPASAPVVRGLATQAEREKARAKKEKEQERARQQKAAEKERKQKARERAAAQKAAEREKAKVHREKLAAKKQKVKTCKNPIVNGTRAGPRVVVFRVFSAVQTRWSHVFSVLLLTRDVILQQEKERERAQRERTKARAKREKEREAADQARAKVAAARALKASKVSSFGSLIARLLPLKTHHSTGLFFSLLSSLFCNFVSSFPPFFFLVPNFCSRNGLRPLMRCS